MFEPFDRSPAGTATRLLTAPRLLGTKGEPSPATGMSSKRVAGTGQGQGKAFSGISSGCEQSRNQIPGSSMEAWRFTGHVRTATCCHSLKMKQETITDSTAWHSGDVQRTGDLEGGLDSHLSTLGSKIATSQNSYRMCIVFSEELQGAPLSCFGRL